MKSSPVLPHLVSDTAEVVLMALPNTAYLRSVGGDVPLQNSDHCSVFIETLSNGDAQFFLQKEVSTKSIVEVSDHFYEVKRSSVIYCDQPAAIVVVQRVQNDLSDLHALYVDVTGDDCPLEKYRAIEYASRVRNFLENIIAIMPGSVYWKDVNCVYLGGNNNAARLANLPSRQDFRGKRDIDFARAVKWDEAVAEKWFQDDMAIMQSGEPRFDIVEPPFLRPDGSTIYQLSNKVPLFNEENDIVGMMGISIDVTKLRQIEHELQQVSIQNQLLLDFAADGIYGLDDQQRIVFINTAGAHMLGWERDELIGKDPHQVFHFPPELPCKLCELSEHAATKITVHECEFLTFTHRRIPIDYTCMQITDSDRISVVVTFRDITARKEQREKLEHAVAQRTTQLHLMNASLQKEIANRLVIEEQLRKSEEMYRVLTTLAPVGIIRTDTSGHGQFFNEHACDMIGLTPYQARGHRWIRSLHKDDRHKIALAWGNANAGDYQQKLEVRLAGKNGAVIGLAQAMAYYSAEQKVLGYVVAITNITKLREAEKELHTHQNKLAHTHRVNTVGEMVVGIAHEINQPLTAIIQYTGGCLRRLQHYDLPSDVIDALNRVCDLAERTGDIIHRLKNFLRYHELKREMVDVNLIIKETVELVNYDRNDSAIDISCDFDQGIPAMLLDKVQIQQVILNIIRNSIDALTESTQIERKITIKTRRTSRELITITIDDNGPGLSIAQQKNMFQPFFTSKKSGMGMGLAISRSIIEEHGGRIHFDNSYTNGCRCILELSIQGKYLNDAE